jgi:hypothetical protein
MDLSRKRPSLPSIDSLLTTYSNNGHPKAWFNISCVKGRE